MIVLNWNGRDDTPECLGSLLRSDYPALKTIVVDNGSTDGSGDDLERRFPGVCVIRSAQNLGFVRGNNLGLAAGLNQGADLLFVLNDDTVVEPDCITKLVQAFEQDPSLGVGGPLMRRTLQPERLDMGSDFDFWTGAARVRQFQAGNAAGGVQRIHSVWGCSMMIRAAVLREIGLFDERYIAYFEDADLCLRARTSGWTVAAVTGARLIHKMGRSGDRRFLWQTGLRLRNHVLFFLGHARAVQYPSLIVSLLLYRIPEIGLQAARVYLARRVKARYRDRPISLWFRS